MSEKRSRYDDIEVTGNDQDVLKIIRHSDDRVNAALGKVKDANSAADASIASSEAILSSLGYDTTGVRRRAQVKPAVAKRKARMLTWEELCAEARDAYPEDLSILEVLSEGEIAKSESKVEALREKFDLQHRLDGLDWGIAGIAGAISALVDLFLVQIPSTPGRLGGAGTKGGWLSDKIRGKLKTMYSPEQIREFEENFHVCFDAAHSADLRNKVAGLGPRSHRFQSLGHDPILGFIFGVRDVMKGEFTAIDKFGKVVRQTIPGAEQGVGLFKAIGKVFGHLKSDVGTPAGLPAPFMPLFQLLQFGDIDGRTIGELARAMYGNGYDFGHFLAMSIPVMVIEVIVRLLFFAKRMHEGNSFMDSLPIDIPFRKRQPKLQTMLFTAHTIATAANAGKVWFMHNPLAINLPQWQWYAKVSYSQLRWVLFTKPAERLAFVQKDIDADWQKINDDLSRGWTFLE